MCVCDYVDTENLECIIFRCKAVFHIGWYEQSPPSLLYNIPENALLCVLFAHYIQYSYLNVTHLDNLAIRL